LRKPCGEAVLRLVPAVLVGCVAAMWPGMAGWAQSVTPMPHFEERAPVVELEVPPPAYPAAGALTRFPIDNFRQTVLIDAETILVGDDGIVRFVLVLRSPSGAETVSFEGIRCNSMEQKVYALGRQAGTGGTWVAARTSQWRPIGTRGTDPLRAELWRDVLCNGALPESRKAMLEYLRRGGRSLNPGYRPN
jgi:CNP1-like family